MKKISLLLIVFLVACIGKPENVNPVTGFDKQRYLGKWYEIARLDHSFERGLDQVTAEYSLRPDGGIKVVNRGFSKENNEWSQANGKAYFVDSENIAHLKVSFFGPFYASYIVFDLDREYYQYAFVSGPDTEYLWLLSREPSVSPAILEKFISTSKTLGFDTEALIMVNQKKN